MSPAVRFAERLDALAASMGSSIDGYTFGKDHPVKSASVAALDAVTSVGEHNSLNPYEIGLLAIERMGRTESSFNRGMACGFAMMLVTEPEPFTGKEYYAITQEPWLIEIQPGDKVIPLPSVDHSLEALAKRFRIDVEGEPTMQRVAMKMVAAAFVNGATDDQSTWAPAQMRYLMTLPQDCQDEILGTEWGTGVGLCARSMLECMTTEGKSYELLPSA